MSEARDYEFDPWLLDLHLGHLSEAEQAELRRQIAGDPMLASQDEALATAFRALGALQAQPMPADLPARTLARVQAAGPAPRVIRPADGLTRAVERHGWRLVTLGGNLRDVIAIAALIVLAIGIGVPGMLHMRDRQQRLGCSWNLAQLGRGVQQYANVFGGNLPFAGWSSGNSWQPSNDPRVELVPNRRHVYPLLRMAYIGDPRQFICPSQAHVPMPRDEIQRHHDFLEGRNVSYAYQNMAGRRASTHDDPRMPILADENPLFADGIPLFDARRLAHLDPARANSRAHAGAGQNVLTLIGEVRWVTTPFAGVNDDNIWTLDGVTDYTGREGPLTATDSHLLK
ncbi:MAG TPA: hypothetical protein PLP66_06240 [Phycisphaerae bacterium]|nr:hypothetical protein [Phycisphaerae bacterium]